MSHGSEKRIRDQHITIRLSSEERAVVDTAAERAGLTPGSYARRTLLGAEAPRQVRRPPVEKRELARLLGAIGKVGGNLNQIAKAVNSGALVYGGEIDAGLGDLKEVCAAILAALGRSP